MALAKRIKTLEDVEEYLRGEYKKDGEVFVLDVTGDEDITGLKNAHERVKEERNTLRDQLKAKDSEFADYKSKVDNIPALEKSWSKKVEKVEEAAKASNAVLAQALHRATVGAEASSLAVKIFKAPKVLQHLIEKRLTSELDETGAPKIRVLDKEGKPSAMTIEELGKEFEADKDLAPVIIGSRSSGGGAPPPRVSSEAGKPTAQEALTASLSGFAL